MKKRYKKNERDLKNLINKIRYIDVELIEDINIEIKKIKEENKKISKQITRLDSNQFNGETEMSDCQIEKLASQVINHFFDSFTHLDIMKQRKLLKLFISSAVCHDESVEIQLSHIKGEDFFQ